MDHQRVPGIMESSDGNAGFPLGNSRLGFSPREGRCFVDVSIQVDLPTDVINPDSDDETMGRKKFSALRSKKSTPVYSKEDIREQYCINSKQVDVLDSAQARTLFGCLPNQEWKSCHHRSSLLLPSCVRRPKSQNDDNLSFKPVQHLQQPRTEPIPPAPPPPVQHIQQQQLQQQQQQHRVSSDALPQQQQPLTSTALPQPEEYSRSDSAEDDNGPIKRRPRSLSGVIEPRRTCSVSDRDDIAMSARLRPRSETTDGIDLTDGGFLPLKQAQSSSGRPTLLRLKSQDSDAWSSGDSHDGTTGGASVAVMPKAAGWPSSTLPNTPECSRSTPRWKQQPKSSPESASMSTAALDERRSKHVSFDAAALARSHPAITTLEDGSLPYMAVVPADTRKTGVSPEHDRTRHRSQERLIDGKPTPSKRPMTPLGSLKSLEIAGLALATSSNTALALARLRRSMRTQATQTEITTLLSTQSPISESSVLSPGLLTPKPKVFDVCPEGTPSAAVKDDQSTVNSKVPGIQLRPNGKKLVKSRSDSECKFKGHNDVRMTVVHLDDTALLKNKSKRESWPWTGPSGDGDKKQRKGAVQEIMVTFKPATDDIGQSFISASGHPRKRLEKTFSEGDVLVAVRPPGFTVYRGRSEERAIEPSKDDTHESGLHQRASRRGRTGSDPLILDNGQHVIKKAKVSKLETPQSSEEAKEVVPEGVTSGPDDRDTPKSSDTGSLYYSLTDPSTSSKTPSVPKAPLTVSKKAELKSVTQTVPGSESNILPVDVSDEEDGETLSRSSTVTTPPTPSSGDVDKTIGYSSETEYGSAQSEESRTVLADAKGGISSAAADGFNLKDISLDSSIGAILSHGTAREALRFMHLAKEGQLTSPESETSSCPIGERELRQSQKFRKPKISTVITTRSSDSAKSDVEGSETSEDYHTATEHSGTDGLCPVRSQSIRTPVESSEASGHSEYISVAGKQDIRPSAPSSSCTRPVVFPFRNVTEIEITAPLPPPPPMFAEPEDVFYLGTVPCDPHRTEMATGSLERRSSSSPHASTLSIESSTSGSYTLESGFSEHEVRVSNRFGVDDDDLDTEFASDHKGGVVLCSLSVLEGYPGRRRASSDHSSPESPYDFNKLRQKFELASLPATPVVNPATPVNPTPPTPVVDCGSSAKVPSSLKATQQSANAKEVVLKTGSKTGPPLPPKPIISPSGVITPAGQAGGVNVSEEKPSELEDTAAFKHLGWEIPVTTSLSTMFQKKAQGTEKLSDRRRKTKKHKSRSVERDDGHRDAPLRLPEMRMRRSVSESPERSGHWSAKSDKKRSSGRTPGTPGTPGTPATPEPEVVIKDHGRSLKRESLPPLAIASDWAAKELSIRSTSLEVFPDTSGQTTAQSRDLESDISRVLCSHCEEKVRRIHEGDLPEGSWRSDERHLDHAKMDSSSTAPSMAASGGGGGGGGGGARPKDKDQLDISRTPKRAVSPFTMGDAASCRTNSEPSSIAEAAGIGKTSSASVRSSMESLPRRSPGAASSSTALDSPGPSGSSLSWTDISQLQSTADGLEDDDDDVGIYAESYRSSAWIYIGENEELTVWKGRPSPSVSPSTMLGEDSKVCAEEGCVQDSADGAEVENIAQPMAAGVAALIGSSDANLHRTDSLESTASEKEFRRKYQAITHRMVHRKSSVEMYKRLSNRTFECDKTVIVLRHSGEFGFRIHGSRPVVVSAIEPGTPAESSGLEVGDIVIAVNGVNVLDASHSEVVRIAHTGLDTLRLDVARTCHLLTPIVTDVDGEREIVSGFLYKLGGAGSLVRKWCRRWVVLKRDNCLYFYKTENSKEPLGAVMLLHHVVSRVAEMGKPFAFKVARYGAPSAHILAAEDEEALNKWASAINQAASWAGQSDPWLEISSRNVQLPALSLYGPDCHGFVAKLGQRWRTWKRRYCVLKDACLYFYTDVGSATALGVAHLHGYRVQSCQLAGRKHTFEAVPPEPRMKHFYFSTDNDTDRKRWLAALEYSIDRWIKVG